MEYWDAYDNKGNKHDVTLTRGEKIPDGYYHLVTQILVRHTDNSFLLMKRDLEKTKYPGYYEASAGGSVLKGETSLIGAKRELQEETGINETIQFDYIDQKIFGHSIFISYLAVVDIDKDNITFQEGETIDYTWISTDDFIAYCKSEYAVENQIEVYKKYIETL